MCGIAGILNLNGEPVSPELLEKMTDAIIHRGPDDSGIFVDGPTGLGHRRLAVIDLTTAGRQPMATPDGRLNLTYNGEIYNFRELRTELERLGHQFHSQTDSEVVLHAYDEWGTDCIQRFNGMFAFAVWDSAKKQLFLARDRYGIKPLYYTFQGKSFFFASEQKAILTQEIVKKEIDLEALLEYFTFQNIFTNKTLLKGIHLFPPGNWAILNLDNLSTCYKALHFTQYWDFNFREPNKPAKEEEYIEELDRLFQQAVSRQLVSDVPVGAYLSGGMDSGSITAIAARQLPWMSTFTCGMDLHSASGLELGFDEREAAEHMSYLFKTEHYEMVLKAGDMERVMPKLVWHLEEPRVGQSYPNYYVAQLASKFVKVVLAGTGGDEQCRFRGVC
jgi:asparagine synthase (glutamine-hydrolysing)